MRRLATRAARSASLAACRQAPELQPRSLPLHAPSGHRGFALCAPSAGLLSRQRAASLLPPSCALLRRHDSTAAAAASASLPAAASLPLVVPHDVASIASESNAVIANLQYFIETLHLQLELPWCVPHVSPPVHASSPAPHLLSGGPP